MELGASITAAMDILFDAIGATITYIQTEPLLMVFVGASIAGIALSLFRGLKSF